MRLTLSAITRHIPYPPGRLPRRRRPPVRALLGGVAPVIGWDLTARTPGASAAKYKICNFSAYYSAGTNTKHVIYVIEDYHLHDIAWTPGSGIPEHFDLTTLTDPRLPPARGRPAAFTVEALYAARCVPRRRQSHL